MHNNRPRTTYPLTQLAALIGALLSPAVQAVQPGASFDIASGVTVTSTQKLDDNQSGMIQTGGALNVAGANAVNAPGNAVQITNSGTLSTTGNGALGINSTGANAIISSSGTLLTTGIGAYGIWSTGTNATVTNSGSIATTGVFAVGIVSIGDNATVSNSGSIATTSDFAYGIYSSGANATVTNNGSIATTGGFFLVGIVSIGDNATVSNSGSIATTGDSSYGIYSGGANSTVTNTGSIATTGVFALGILSIGDNSTVTNTGSISVSGTNSIGIQSLGTNGVINLSGLVSATGAGAKAIFGAGNQTLNLLPNAAVIGPIDLGAGTNRVNVTTAAAPSTTLSITNPGTITQSGKGLSLVSGNTIVIADTSNLTANQASLGLASSTLFQAVNQQLNQSAPAPQPVKVAANELTPGMLHQDPGPAAWGHVFGGQARRDDSGAALAYKDNGYGLIGGYEQTLSEYRVGVFGGVSRSTLDTDTSSISTDSDSVFLGVYGQYASSDWLVNGSLAAGYVSYDNKRLVLDNLSGYQSAKSDYHSTYLSPSVAVIRIFDMGDGLSLRPSAQLNYTYGWLSSYDEKGTTRSNLSVGSRNASVLNSRVQVAIRQELADHQGEFEFRAGASNSNYGNDRVKISLQGGAATNFGITGTSSLTGGYVGASGRIALKNELSLVGDVEYTQSSSDTHAAVGYMGMEYRF